MPVGSSTTSRVNVRIIAATNRNLEAEVMENRFREDLYYRLAVVPIRVPPLRERKGDVPILVDHFLKKYSNLLGKKVQKISSYGLKVLMDYDFPGNVRELENIIERGVALESSNIILPESLILSRKIKNSHVQQPLFVAAEDEQDLFERGMEDILVSLETKIIRHALQKTGGSKMRAAELLKISFRSLRYKTKKYDID
jgi:two-component system response regulator PilR (NtrC family)